MWCMVHPLLLFVRSETICQVHRLGHRTILQAKPFGRAGRECVEDEDGLRHL